MLYRYTSTNDCVLIPECNKSVAIPHLPPNSVCHLSDTCTDIECCIDTPLLHRPVNFQFALEPCDYRMTVRIEGMEYQLMLYNYSWGTQDSFWLRGVFRVRCVS